MKMVCSPVMSMWMWPVGTSAVMSAMPKKAVGQNVKLPAGYSITWSGQYEYMERVKKRLSIFIPMSLIIIFLLYYFNFKSIGTTLLILLAMPFTAMGAIWSVFILRFNMSIAIWAGMMEVVGNRRGIVCLNRYLYKSGL